jgi:hypothetical protein
MAFEELHFSRMFQIRQTFEVPPPVDPDDAVDDAFLQTGSELVSVKGMSVAVCVGSRGIDGIFPIVKRAVLSQEPIWKKYSVLKASKLFEHQTPLILVPGPL